MSLQARSFNGTENKLLTDIKWSALKLHVNNFAPKSYWQNSNQPVACTIKLLGS